MYVKSSLNYSKNTLCFCTYRHPNTDVQVFLDRMYNVLQKTTKERKDIFFMGDFNLNLLNYDTHSETNGFITLMMTLSFASHIASNTSN